MIPALTISSSGQRKPPADNQKFAQLLEQARQDFKHAMDATSQQREEARDDMDFRAGKQWSDEIKADRAQTGRPCLTINRMQQFIGQVTNETRQNRPSAQVSPRGDGAETETAEIYEGLLRDIEVASNADYAYDTAFDHAATCGFGWIRILKEYVSEDSFDQQLVIRRVADPFKVVMDPNAQEPDFSDAKYAFVFDDLTTEEFERMFPGADPAGLTGFQALGDYGQYWYPENRIRVAEYFFIEEIQDSLYLLDDGTTVLKSEYDKRHPQGRAALVVEPPQILRQRKTTKRQVRWVKLSGAQVLQETVWEGRYIPIVPVLGSEIILDGKRQFVGMVRFAKDAQRQYNYMRSAAVEAIALAPKAPWVAEWDQIAEFQDQWKGAHTRNQAVLPYKGVSGENGAPLPPPQRNVVEPPIQAISIAIGQAENDLQATMGIYKPSLGDLGPERSGKAILALQKEGDVANFNLVDNLSRAQRHVYRICIDEAPYVYDQPRVERICKPDNTTELVLLNQLFVEGNQPGDFITDPQHPAFQNGKPKRFDLANKTARYDVQVTTGPSYATKRQEAVNSILQLVQAFPQIMGVAGDLLVSYMDWHGAKEVAKRLKALLPPAVQQQEQAQNGQADPQIQAKLVQVLQQNQQLANALHQAVTTIETKKMDLDSKERIALWNAKVALITALAKTQSAEALKLADLDYGAIEHSLNLLPPVAAAESTPSADSGSGPSTPGTPTVQ